MRGTVLELMRPVTVRLVSGEVLDGWSWSPGFSTPSTLTVWQQTGVPQPSSMPWKMGDGRISPPDSHLLTEAERERWLRRWVFSFHQIAWWTEGVSFRESPDGMRELTRRAREMVAA